MSLYVHGVWSNISPDKWTFIDKIVRTYAIFQSFEHLFWVLKRTVIETALLSIKKIVFLYDF